MFYMIKEFKTAFDKAKEVNKLLQKDGFSDDMFIPLANIISCVRTLTKFDEIIVSTQSFSASSHLEKFKESGAMLETNDKNDNRYATLIVNSDYSPEFQRFSLVHELGHLITEIPNFTYEIPNDGKFTLSTHIKSDITYINTEMCKENKYLMAEQVANIFALLVLIRKDIAIRDLINGGANELVKRYGVSEDALYSRMLLSNIQEQG